MNMTDWAKREVEIVCKPTKGDEESADMDHEYYCMCAASALKAFESLVGDNHSGFSINLTKHILNRLIESKPLTPIEDDPDIWNEITSDHTCTRYQCKRMSALFKYVYSDGTIKYTDIDRCIAIDIHNPRTSFHPGFVSEMIDRMFPIVMPYSPDGYFKVYREEFLTDERNGDYDTQGVLYLITPDNEKVEVNRFFKEDGREWVEIDEDEYEKRKARRIK